jgi:hypothetical protein
MATPEPIPPAPLHKSPNNLLKIFGGIVGGIFLVSLGVAVGSTSHSATADAATSPTPAPTVTVAKVATPAVCIDALSKADTLMADYGQALDTVGPAITALENYDSIGIQKQTDKLNTLNPIILQDRAAYDSAKSACKG